MVGPDLANLGVDDDHDHRQLIRPQHARRRAGRTRRPRSVGPRSLRCSADPATTADRHRLRRHPRRRSSTIPATPGPLAGAAELLARSGPAVRRGGRRLGSPGLLPRGPPRPPAPSTSGGTDAGSRRPGPSLVGLYGLERAEPDGRIARRARPPSDGARRSPTAPRRLRPALHRESWSRPRALARHRPLAPRPRSGRHGPKRRWPPRPSGTRAPGPPGADVGRAASATRRRQGLGRGRSWPATPRGLLLR